MSTQDVLGDYVDEGEVAKVLNVKLRTLRLWWQQRHGPPWVKPTRGMTLYSKSALREWLKANEVHGGRSAA